MTSDAPASHPDTAPAAPTSQDPAGQAINQAIDSFRARLLNLRTMPWSLRLVVALVFLTIVTLGVLLALRDTLPGFGDDVPFALGDANTASRDVVLAAPFFVLALVALGLAWALLLTGAIHSRWYVRFPVIAVFTFFAFLEAGSGVPLGADAAARFTSGEGLAITIQLAVVALVWFRAILVSIVQWRAERRGEAPSARLAGVTFLLLAIALGAHYWYAWSAASEAGQAGLFSGIVGTEVTFLFLPLIPLIFIAGSDIAEVGVSLADGAARLLRLNRAPWLLALANALIAGGVLVWSILSAFNDADVVYDPLNVRHNATALVLVLIFVGFGCLFALVGWGVFALARRVGMLEAAPRATMPYVAYLIATLVFFLGFALLAALIVGLGAPLVFEYIIPLIGFVVGFALMAAQRNRPGWLTLTGLLVALTSSLGFLALLNQVSGQTNGGVAILIILSLATLATLLWLLVRLRVNQRSAVLLGQLLTLNVGVLVIAGVLAFLDQTHTSGGRVSGVAALVFVGAFAWDLLTSGRVTNATSKRFPRHVRVYLYLGYTLLLTTVVVLLAAISFNNDATARTIREGFNQEQYGHYGLLTLGVATLFATFVLRVSRAAAPRRPAGPLPYLPRSPYPAVPPPQTPPYAPYPQQPYPQQAYPPQPYPTPPYPQQPLYEPPQR
jgi:hypothetical protein